MNIRKIFCAMTVLMLLGLALAGCSTLNKANNAALTDDKQGEHTVTEQSAKENSYEKQNITVAALKGPTAIGMVQIMKNAKDGNASDNYSFKIAGTADEFTADLIKGEVQIAALPCNAAATLYNKSNGKIKVMGINTLGVLYIIDTGNDVNSVQDLKGKTIYSTGKGTTPEYTLRYLLKSAGIDPDKDVKIEFKSEATEVAALLKTESGNSIAMLPQPYVTTVLNQNSKARIALDVTKEWEKLVGGGSTVVTGVIAVNSEFAEKNQQALERFMEEYKKSSEFVNSDVSSAVALVEEFGIFKAEIAQKAIPYCNITLIQGSDMKKKIGSYLSVLNGENPASIGGAMPKDDFYLDVKQD